MMKIAILGAHGSGKTQLANELSAHFRAPSTVDKALLIADAPPLMAALGSAALHDDPARIDLALARHQHFDLTLLCGLDLPASEAEPAAREALDAQLRLALARGKVAYAVVYGLGATRTRAALQAIAAWRAGSFQPAATPGSRWQGYCETCSEPACERRLFTPHLARNPR